MEFSIPKQNKRINNKNTLQKSAEWKKGSKSSNIFGKKSYFRYGNKSYFSIKQLQVAYGKSYLCTPTRNSPSFLK